MNGDGSLVPGPVPMQQALRVDEVCDRFEDALRAAQKPRIEDFLGPASGPERSDLLRELLALDLHWRQRRGERPKPRDYQQRFPGDAALVDAMFREHEDGRPRAPEPAQVSTHPGVNPAYDLLLGLLALQNSFVDRTGLLDAFNIWVADKSKPIGRILVDRGALSANRLTLLEGLVEEHLKEHGGDPEHSLAILSSIGSVRDDLAKLGDPDLAYSLGHVSVARSPGPTPPDDPSVTALWTGDAVAVAASARYRVLRQHARGGLGVVSVALDEQLNREVAFKEILELNADDPQSRARFEREAEVTAGLEHPGIVPVYGVGRRANGRPFYVMRFVRGISENNSLSAAIKELHGQSHVNEHSPTLNHLLRRFIVACQAIDYAHSRGVLHRDIKPGNIIIGKHGETLVVDWGLAKPLGHKESDATPDEPTLRPHADVAVEGTQRGSKMGTPGYMSPEQAAGSHDELGPNSDVYSLGATLYNLLTGHSPFEGDNYPERLKKNEQGEFPAPRKVCSWVPRALEAVCLKAMAKKPEDRFESARALAADVERWMDDEPVSAWREPIRDRVARWARHHKPLMAGVLVLSLTVPTFLAAITVIWTQRNAAQREKLVQEYLYLVEPPKEANRKPGWTWNRIANLRRAAALNVPQRSPTRLRSEVADCLATVDVREVGPRLQSLLALGQDASCLAFSPDSRFLALGQHKTTIPATFQVRVVDLESASFRSFSLPTAGDLGVLGFLSKLASLTKAESQGEMYEGARTISFTPRGDGLVVGTRHGWVHYLVLGEDKPRPVSWRAHQSSVTALTFDPEARHLISGSEDGTVKRWDLDMVRAGQAPVADVLQFDAGVHAVRALPGSGSLACATGGQIVLVEAATLKRLSNYFPIGIDRIAVSPDGRTVAASTPTGEGSAGVRVITLNPEHNEEIRGFQDPSLPSGESHVTGSVDLEFSQDGSLLATVSDDDRDRVVKLWEVATGRLLLNFRATGRDMVDTCFSPDGRFLAVTGADGATLYELGGIKVKTSLAHQSHPISAISLESRGTNLACVTEPRNPSGRACDPEVTLWDTVAGKRMNRYPVTRNKPAEFCTDLTFHPNGNSLASSWTSNRILVIDPSTGREFITIAADDPTALGFSPNGSTLWAAAGKYVRSWSVSDWKENRSWSNDAASLFSGRLGINCLAVAGIWVVAGGSDGTVKSLSGIDGSQLLSVWRASSMPLWSIAYSRENLLIAAGALDGTVSLFRPTGELVTRLDGHRDSVETICFSPGGRLMVTGSRDRTIRLWRIAGGKAHELLTLNEPTGPVHSVTFSPDGQSLYVVVRGDLAVRVWHLDWLRATLIPLGLDWD